MSILQTVSRLGSCAALLLIVGCGAAQGSEPSTAASGAQQVTVSVGNSMSFDPAEFSVEAGQPIQVQLHNTGVMPHDFTLSEGVQQAVKISVNGGQTASGTFVIQQPGTYTFICSMPGHASAGMRGTITAT